MRYVKIILDRIRCEKTSQVVPACFRDVLKNICGQDRKAGRKMQLINIYRQNNPLDEKDKVFLDIKCLVGPNPFPNLDLAIS